MGEEGAFEMAGLWVGCWLNCQARGGGPIWMGYWFGRRKGLVDRRLLARIRVSGTFSQGMMFAGRDIKPS